MALEYSPLNGPRHRKRLIAIIAAVVGVFVVVAVLAPTLATQLGHKRPIDNNHVTPDAETPAPAASLVPVVVDGDDNGDIAPTNVKIRPPCVFRRNVNDPLRPANCVERIVPISCTDTTNKPHIDIFASRCAKLEWGLTQKVRFQIGKDDKSKGACYQVESAVSECWGKHPDTGSDYTCQGRCGAGCNGLPGGWSADCWKHDICSWFFGSKDGTNDANCGLTFKHASTLGCSPLSNTCYSTPP
eukprot:TRINITY_DN89_c0_g1_i4.p1 TRINITY_DN89_c0_g1~~TRINITY_DN89_c0_g1_i4.p1  ORF type:complete len:243 (+),score=38.27 TRINITY_DN89_c0_g1_i4:54-782(+)